MHVKTKCLGKAKRRELFSVHAVLRESEKSRCEKVLARRANFFDHVRLFQSSFCFNFKFVSKVFIHLS